MAHTASAARTTKIRTVFGVSVEGAGGERRPKAWNPNGPYVHPGSTVAGKRLLSNRFFCMFKGASFGNGRASVIGTQYDLRYTRGQPPQGGRP